MAGRSEKMRQKSGSPAGLGRKSGEFDKLYKSETFMPDPETADEVAVDCTTRDSIPIVTSILAIVQAIVEGIPVSSSRQCTNTIIVH